MKKLIIILAALGMSTPALAEEQTGQASWYGHPHTGRPTASGEIFNPRELTAAHRTLPFGTRVTVTYRGPFAKGRIIDLSEAAASRIGLKAAGHGRVTISF
jgi:rare lipoprotein A